MFNLSGFRQLPALLLVLSFLVLSSSVQAQTLTSVRGLGLQKCTGFTEALAKRDRVATLLYSQWLAGFLTGKNAASPKMDLFPIRGPLDEWTKLIAMICTTNSDKEVFRVAEATLTKLKKYYIDPNDKALEIKYNDDKKIIIYRSFLKKSQSFLRSKRYSVRPDGNWGSKTEKAFSKFKKDNNIAGPPIPDAFFVMALIANK